MQVSVLCVISPSGLTHKLRYKSPWVAMRPFNEPNGYRQTATPTVDGAERAVLAIGAGEWEVQFADWLRRYLTARAE
jgi:hypothetical protein